VRAQLILCDAAQADPSGKVHILGAGWMVTQTPLPPQAVVAIIEVGWNESDEMHSARLQLEDADGRIVSTGDPEHPQPMLFDQKFQVGRPVGVPEGTSTHAPIVLNMAPGLPVAPGTYMWRLLLDGESDVAWTASFHVRPPG
jgi:hypothetical protein